MIIFLLIEIVMMIQMSQSNAYEKVHQYNPNGRIFQLERAKKASQKGNPIIGIKCNDGVIIVLSRKKNLSPLIKSTPEKHFLLDKNIQFVVSGLSSDGKAVADVAKSICDNYKNTYMTPIPLESLCEELSAVLHRQTFSVVTRPVGLRGIIIGWDVELGFQVYTMEPDGSYAAYKYVCIGGNQKLEIMNDFEQEHGDDALRHCQEKSIKQVYPSLLSILKRRFRKDADTSSLLSSSPLQRKTSTNTSTSSSDDDADQHANEEEENESSELDIDLMFGYFKDANSNRDDDGDESYGGDSNGDGDESEGERRGYGCQKHLIWSSLPFLSHSK